MYGNDNVIAMYRATIPKDAKGPYIIGNAMDKKTIEEAIKLYDINVIYHLGAILSAHGEKNPEHAYNTNMESLKNVLDIAKERK